jgi:hypothetical protein
MKTAWEARIGVLLDSRHHPEFLYSFKPYDSPMYGGQPRIDWHAADMLGRYWMIEVKSLPVGRKSFTLSEVTPGQMQALKAISKTQLGVPLLAVGQGKTLYLYGWRQIQKYISGGAGLLPLTAAHITLDWSPKKWQSFNLHDAALDAEILPILSIVPRPLVVAGSPAIPPIPPFSGSASNPIPPVPSPSISKQPRSRRMRLKKLLSAPSLSKPPE